MKGRQVTVVFLTEAALLALAGIALGVPLGILLYITAMWVSGITQGLMWRAYDKLGFLQYSFIETVEAMHPYYTIRAIGGQATLLTLDLADAAAVDAIAPSIFKRFGRLDVLVNCAAVLGRLTPVAHTMPPDWEEAVAVNVTAPLRLIRSCDPLLRNAPAGRAVFITSNRARVPRAYWSHYGATKAAMEYLVLTWAEEVATTPLRVNLFDPGIMRTKLRAAAFPGEDPSKLRPPDTVAPEILPLCLPEETRHGVSVRVSPG